LQQDFLSQHGCLLSSTLFYSDTQPNHAFVKLGIGIKWDLADDGFCPFPYAALCMSGRCSK
jgi:hypothetical protein